MDDKLKLELKKAVNKCFALALKLYGLDIPYPEIKLNLKSINNGAKAIFKPAIDISLLRFNFGLYKAMPKLFIEEVVPHEVAHIIASKLGYKGHLAMWYTICIALGGTGETYLSRELGQRLRSLNKTYTYSCKCSTHRLTPIRHKRIKKGGHYRCDKCRELLVENKSEVGI